MSLQKLYQRVAVAPAFGTLTDWVRAQQQGPALLQLKGWVGSLPAFGIHHLQRKLSERPLLCLLEDPEAAAYLFSDLQQLQGHDDGLLLFPPTGHKPYDEEQIDDPAPLIQRADVLRQLAVGFRGILITSLEALVEKVPPEETIETEAFTLVIGQQVVPNDLAEQLVEHGFARGDFVEQPGELALRGGILDVFPFAGDHPIRLEFFGDEIDSIREFDVQTQRSISRLTTAQIVPNLERRTADSPPGVPLFDYLPPATPLALFGGGGMREAVAEAFDKAAAAFAARPEAAPPALPPPDRFLPPAAFEQALSTHPRLHFGSFNDEVPDETLLLGARPQPDFNSRIQRLREQIHQNTKAGIDTLILCDSRGQENRLFDLLEDERDTQRLRLKVESLHEGFELPDLGLAVYTDHQIFNRYHRPTARKQKKRFGSLSIRELQNLSPGDFVVHVDYGIGTFAGMQKIEVRGKQQEAVRLLYQGGDVLYVNVNALYKLHKYTGKEGHQPRLTKLGSGQWERTKARTKKRVKDIARDLIKLYARRRDSKGHAFPQDSLWQRELEVSFQYEDTPDQAEAAESVKRDMEQPVPMDRLVCGDVGFGKTEVAVRAAFKAVQDGKQVAILVPTTVLASQHYRTFKKRLAEYPVRVEVLSRFRNRQEQKDVLARLEKGDVDIIVGTHRLVSKDVKFKDLGLLIIDEEQRFGVSVKEKLRQLRVDVDTLTLTATPIPRTLQFSLLGARDLSIIATAPPNRQPIITEIHTFDKDLVRDAILYEVNRGGQVFFIHNRVQSIEEIAEMLRSLIPDIRIQVGHGQMKPAQLEKVMHGFVSHKYDVLVSTSIIENGLDISNANTIIIDRANHFGLSELHQLRGRVGRSDRKAFCYLLVPSIHSLTREAKQRLQAIEEFSDLGSGFNIAMRDLDIRGAGSLLGAEQSGFIEDVGYETYHKILEEAVQELRQDEFGELFDEAPAPPAGETSVDLEADALIPATYLPNNVERLNLYRRISETTEPADLSTLQEEMADRFGAVPEEVITLFAAMRLKLLGQRLRLAKVVYKNQRLFLEIPSQEQDPYFYAEMFYPWLEKLNGLAWRYVLRETKSKKRLRAIIQDVPDLQAAERVLATVQLTSLDTPTS